MTLHRAELAGPADFASWRTAARSCLAEGIPPQAVLWTLASPDQASVDLFASSTELLPSGPRQPASGDPTVPRSFIELAKTVICHSASDRFALLYRLLWRLQAERHLLEVATDPDVQRAEALAKSVRRDKHKMTAFVRFREVKNSSGSVWIAWFEPQHHIVEATAPFFVRRFASMNWSILTPRTSAHWNGEELTFTQGAKKSDAPTEDALEDHWRIYFSSIFNPARLNTSAMQREMPKKYWKNMPETSLIPELVRAASARTTTMLQNPAPPPRVSVLDKVAAAMRKTRPEDGNPDRAPEDLRDLNAQLDGCRLCPLWRDATQAVHGAGAVSAEIMVVGEQPGDVEDLEGVPFVGPAGKLLTAALSEAGLPREALYLTNAVKHFKFEPRGKRRLHKKPNASEIDTCRWWLAHEIRLIRPKLIVALGATAAGSLLQQPVKIADIRGRPVGLDGGTSLFVTVHPSYLLRLPDPQVAALERQRFVADLRQARDLAQGLGLNLNAA